MSISFIRIIAEIKIDNQMEIVIDEIKTGLPGISRAIGCHMFEACFVSLAKFGKKL